MNSEDKKEEVNTIISNLSDQVQKLRAEKKQLLDCLGLNLERQLQEYMTTLQLQSQRDHLLSSVSLRIRQSLNLSEILQTTVNEVRHFLQNERVILYRFEPNWDGEIIVESVETPRWSLQGRNIYDPCWESIKEKFYQPDSIHVFEDREKANLILCYDEFLEQLEIRANLVLPILLTPTHTGKKSTACDHQLWGLLMAQNCSKPRNWMDWEIDFLRQLAVQVAIAIQQASLVTQLENELAQRRKAELALKTSKANLEVKVRERTLAVEETNLRLHREIWERNQKETRLRLLERAIASSHSGIMISDPTQTENPIIYVNSGFEQMTGYQMAEVIGKNFRFLYREDLNQPGLEEIEIALREERSCSVIVRNYRKDGTLFWQELTISPVRDPEGRLTHYVSIQTDITERIQTQEERDCFFNLSGDLLCIANFDGNFVRVNPAWEQTLGYTENELLSQPFLELIHPEDYDRTIAELERLKNGKKTLEFENRYRCNDGTYRWLLWTATPVVEENRIYAVARDITQRKQVEVELRQREERFRTVANFTYDWESWIDPEGNFLYVSPSCERITGYSPEEFIRNPQLLIAIVHPEDRGIVLEYLQEHLHENQPHFMDFRIVTRSGQIRWLAHHCQSVYSSDGCWLGRRVSSRDISEQKQIEQALRESEERYRRLIETSIEGVWMIDTANRTTFVNPQMAIMLGYPVEEMIGKSIFEFIDQDNWQMAVTNVERRRLGISEQHDLKFRHSSGESLWTSVSTAPIFDTSGKYVGAFAWVTDISKRKQIEEALRESEERFRLMADHAPVLIWISGNDGLRYFFNQSWLSFTGRTLEEEIGNGWTENIHPDDKEAFLQIYQRKFQVKEPFSLEYRLRRADGDYRWLLDTGLPQLTSNREFAGYIGSCIDITENKQTREQLRQINKQLKDGMNALEQRHQEMVLLGEMNSFLQASSSLQEAYQMLADLLKPLFPDCGGGVFMLGESENYVEVVATWGEDFTTPTLFRLDECWALRRGRTHWVEAESPNLFCQHTQAHPLPAESLCIPMMALGNTLGLLYISASTPGELTEAKRQLARTVAEHLAVALANVKLQETFKAQSMRDALTGLFNRRYLEECLEREIHRARRNNYSVGIVMIDIDHFKRFNDQFGHDAGDEVLKTIARLLKNNIRSSDIACRYGGEELTLILPEASLQDTQTRAEQIRYTIEHLQLHHRNQSLGAITASFGVACFPQQGETLETVLRMADTALYQAKTRGRNCVVCADESSL
ncbi:PAS domain S-box protein [Limnoraphis robusta]|uniref:PAS domain S-box protein n=1 Tax=Limnoraphis robusta TaxID=1118279 RepID=UPI00066D9A5A|nr:PAS domain S-box protein [Limnoraphis robusta]